MMLTELRKVIPSFLQRVDRPDRGGEWSAYLAGTTRDTDGRPGRGRRGCWPGSGPERRPVGRTGRHGSRSALVDFDPEGEDKVLAAACFPVTDLPESEACATGCAGPRRRRPGRPARTPTSGSAATAATVRVGPSSAPTTASRSCRTTAPSATCSATGCSPSSGSRSAPARLRRPRASSHEAGEAAASPTSLERSAELYDALLAPTSRTQAAYAVALAFRIRYVMQMNAREAMHLIELRSGPQGHPAYRRVAQQMHQAIAEQAGHRAIAAAMRHVDYGAADLERLEAERRSEARRAARPTTGARSTETSESLTREISENTRSTGYRCP